MKGRRWVQELNDRIGKMFNAPIEDWKGGKNVYSRTEGR